jgi:uncharacterized membrane protein YdjX (TVP38/TMEM64 family)
MESATRRQLVGIAGLLGVAGVATLVFSPETVVGELEGLAERPLVFAVALLSLYLVRPFLLWPVSAVALVLGYLYGPYVAFPLALAGAGLSALPPYLLGRYAGTEAGLFGYVRSSGQVLVDTVGETRSVLAARFSPMPGDPISYAAGLSGIFLRPFLAGTVVGEIPWAFIAILAGTSMRTLTLSEFAFSPSLIIVLACLAVAVLGGPVYNRVAGTTPVE